jgi:glutamine amidotransferase-like uncharacterized protein
MGQIIVYVDQGVDGAALKHTLKSLQQEIDPQRHAIRRMDAAAIKSEPWEKETTLLIIPGGRDVYYHSSLAPEGTLKIRNFVSSGGHYLGLCAGAYFASDFIEFEKGGYLEVLGKRNLEFYPGKAIGPAYGLNKYSYENEKGAEAALISWKEGQCFAYYNGGCYFEGAHNYPDVEVLSTYDHLDGKPAAIVSCKFGKGRAFLSGVHIEYSSHFLSRGSPFLENIAPILHESEEKRRAVFRDLLERMSIQLKKNR